MHIKCSIEECKHNNNGFCKKDFVFIYGGICSELVDKNGNRKYPQMWVKEEFKNFQKSI